MTYCSNCGLIIESYDCPVCGCKNFRPRKPGEDEKIKKTVPTKPVENSPVHKCGPKRSVHMLFGGVGSFLIAISAIILGILPLYIGINGEFMRFNSFGVYIMFLFGTILFMAGSGVLIGGLYGLFKHYGSYRGLVALIFTLISPILLLIFTMLSIENRSYSSSYYNSSVYEYYAINAEIWIGYIFIGIMFILIGMSWRNISYKIGLDQPNVPVGTLYVLAGILIISPLVFTGIPWIMISVASISSGVLFFLARSGTENIQDGRPKWKPYWLSSPEFTPPPPPSID